VAGRSGWFFSQRLRNLSLGGDRGEQSLEVGRLAVVGSSLEVGRLAVVGSFLFLVVFFARVALFLSREWVVWGGGKSLVSRGVW